MRNKESIYKETMSKKRDLHKDISLTIWDTNW